MPILDTTVFNLICVGLFAYLLGSIPFGIVFARLFGLGDLRKIGSGNIGATNVLRTGNKLAAFLTLVCDAGKGGVAVLIAGALFGVAAAQVAGLCAFLGHLYPVYLNFKGGKGVAIFLGIVLCLNFWVGLAACATWLVVAVAMRYSSLAALFAAVLTPLWMLCLGVPNAFLMGCIMAFLVVYAHRENISRLRNGTETKIGSKG